MSLELQRLAAALDSKSEVVLSGAAGTGKTTLIRELGLTGRPLVLLGPTGRAARRLREATGQAASTVHRALYGGVEEDENGELVWQSPQPLGTKGDVVVVDEASMIGGDLAGDIRASCERCGTSLLWVGDPHQLPPVDDLPGCNLQEPDVLLETVHRSSSGVLKFAQSLLRAKGPVALSQAIQRAGQFAGVQVMQRESGWTPERWRAETLRRGCGADAMLLSRVNVQRHEMNAGIREHLGYPIDGFGDGELFLVRSNNRSLGIVNGDLLSLQGDESDMDPDLPENYALLRLVDRLDGRIVRAYVAPADFQADSRKFRENRRDDSQQWWYRWRRGALPRNPRWSCEIEKLRSELVTPNYLIGPTQDAAHVQFGYVLTCHSAQGSEAKAVGICWDAWWTLKRNLEDVRAWWYTAVTRAKESVLIWH